MRAPDLTCSGRLLMTFHTLGGCAPVDTNGLAEDVRLLLMTLLATHVAMRYIQGETSLIVIEDLCAPLGGLVAAGAILQAAAALELSCVDILGGMAG